MRGQLPLLRTPEVGVAAAKCLLNRMFIPGLKLHGTHLVACRFDQFTDDELAAIVDEFNEWSGINKGQLQPTVEAFAMLPIDTQRKLSEAAAMVSE